ncbi:MAG: iron chelate uptake ABC transporter family permease subunit, partial [Bacillota bacterium]
MMNTPAERIPEAGIEYIEKKPSKLKWALMAAFPIFLFTISLFLGRYSVPPNQVICVLGQRLFSLPIETFWTDTVETVVIRVRLPRAIMAALVGAGLS